MRARQRPGFLSRSERATVRIRAGRGIHRMKTQLIGLGRPRASALWIPQRSVEPFDLISAPDDGSTMDLDDDTTPYGFRTPELSGLMRDEGRNDFPLILAALFALAAALTFFLAA